MMSELTYCSNYNILKTTFNIASYHFLGLISSFFVPHISSFYIALSDRDRVKNMEPEKCNKSIKLL